MKKVLLGILIIQLTATICSAQSYTCDPERDCVRSDASDKVPDKTDCRKYYICLPGGEHTPSSASCDDGEYFSTASGDCETGEECEENSCQSDPISCNIDCAKEGVEIIPVAGDCNKFIDCNDPTHTPQSCPPAIPYFNGQFCTADLSECCSVCYYECIEKNTIVADPNDCHAYYYCEDESNGEQLFCNTGDYFNVILKDCVEETVPCSSYCSSTPGTGSGVCNDDFQCPVSFGKYAVCDECITAYYDCSSGTAVLLECPAGELFDYTISDCVPQNNCPTLSLDSA